jgi:hypothetical protein
MHYTNTSRLPKHLFDLLTLDDYEACGLGVTTLIDSPRIAQLKLKYADRLMRDAMDNYHMLLGKAVHAAVARIEGQVVEQRFCAEVGGVQVCGIPDRVEDDRLYDYKTCNTWINSLGLKSDWVSQLNVYRWLLRRNNIVVNELHLIAFYKDWTLSQVSNGRDGYPVKPINDYLVERWLLADTEAFVEERVRLHQEAIYKLPECTPEERWQKDGKYAVHLNGKRRAERLLDSEDEARRWIEDASNSIVSAQIAKLSTEIVPGKGYSIVFRPTEWKRCHEYCDVSEFCEQYQRFRAPAAPDLF